MLEYFKNAWPEGCYNDITKKVGNMAERNKSPHFEESEVFYLKVIYPMLRAPLSNDSNINVWDVLPYELAPVPPFMFTDDGMRLCKKRNLLTRDCSWLKFPEDMKALLAPLSPVSQLFCSLTIHLLNGGTVGDLVETFKKTIASYLTDSDVYLSFYMCYEVFHRDAQKTVQIRIIIWCDLQLFHTRRFCCPQLETRWNLFICPMMTWLRTYLSTHRAWRKTGW